MLVTFTKRRFCYCLSYMNSDRNITAYNLSENYKEDSEVTEKTSDSLNINCNNCWGWHI